MRSFTVPSAVLLFFRRHQTKILAGSLVLLLASVALLKLADSLTNRSRVALQLATARLEEARQLEASAQAQADQTRLGDALVAEAIRSGFSFRDWDERRFNIKQVAMSREGVNTLLGEVARMPGRLFAAEQFEMSVKRQDDGLFSTPRDQNADIVVSLKGSLVFRARKERP
ncbi:MAG: hypothetical protein Q7T87_05600 [Polaromonas sp.]|nr:hypothetical protein [Polaromonas sp.]